MYEPVPVLQGWSLPPGGFFTTFVLLPLAVLFGTVGVLVGIPYLTSKFGAWLHDWLH